MADVKVLIPLQLSVCAPIYGAKVGGGVYVDALVRETWWDGRGFFFCIDEEDGELLDSRHGNVASVITRQEGL